MKTILPTHEVFRKLHCDLCGEETVHQFLVEDLKSGKVWLAWFCTICYEKLGEETPLFRKTISIQQWIGIVDESSLDN